MWSSLFGTEWSSIIPSDCIAQSLILHFVSTWHMLHCERGIIRSRAVTFPTYANTEYTVCVSMCWSFFLKWWSNPIWDFSDSNFVALNLITVDLKMCPIPFDSSRFTLRNIVLYSSGVIYSLLTIRGIFHWRPMGMLLFLYILFCICLVMININSFQARTDINLMIHSILGLLTEIICT